MAYFHTDDKRREFASILLNHLIQELLATYVFAVIFLMAELDDKELRIISEVNLPFTLIRYWSNGSHSLIGWNELR